MGNKLTSQQLKANEDYFNGVAKYSKIFVWKNLGHTYEIQNGNFIANNEKAFIDLKTNTPESFHTKIKMK